jgi:N-ethylmaleimide reductase
MPSLFDPIRIGDITLANRVVMAPLTRNRAGPGQVPTATMAEYYMQRATAGLIVTEATQVSPQGQGYLDTPGIHNAAQVQGWRRITDAVHERGGKIVLQLWHVGRISHVSLQPGGAAPLSSTARTAQTKTFTAEGFVPCSPPRVLTLQEIAAIVASFRSGAGRALQAGFDGVEVHGANG